MQYHTQTGRKNVGKAIRSTLWKTVFQIIHNLKHLPKNLGQMQPILLHGCSVVWYCTRFVSWTPEIHYPWRPKDSSVCIYFIYFIHVYVCFIYFIHTYVWEKYLLLVYKHTQPQNRLALVYIFYLYQYINTFTSVNSFSINK